jgi:hypothetical protein
MLALDRTDRHIRQPLHVHRNGPLQLPPEQFHKILLPPHRRNGLPGDRRDIYVMGFLLFCHLSEPSLIALARYRCALIGKSVIAVRWAMLFGYSHIYSHIKVVFLRFHYALPLGVSAFTQHFQFVLVPPAVHDQADSVPTHTGTELFNIRNAEWADYIAEGVFNQIGL